MSSSSSSSDRDQGRCVKYLIRVWSSLRETMDETTILLYTSTQVKPTMTRGAIMSTSFQNSFTPPVCIVPSFSTFHFLRLPSLNFILLYTHPLIMSLDIRRIIYIHIFMRNYHDKCTLVPTQKKKKKEKNGNKFKNK